jgi:hypothetical protein
MLTPDNCIISEVGDSWFNSQKLKLPRGCGYEMQVNKCKITRVQCSADRACALSFGAICCQVKSLSREKKIDQHIIQLNPQLAAN